MSNYFFISSEWDWVKNETKFKPHYKRRTSDTESFVLNSIPQYPDMYDLLSQMKSDSKRLNKLYKKLIKITGAERITDKKDSFIENQIKTLNLRLDRYINQCIRLQICTQYIKFNETPGWGDQIIIDLQNTFLEEFKDLYSYYIKEVDRKDLIKVVDETNFYEFIGVNKRTITNNELPKKVVDEIILFLNNSNKDVLKKTLYVFGYAKSDPPHSYLTKNIYYNYHSTLFKLYNIDYEVTINHKNHSLFKNKLNLYDLISTHYFNKQLKSNNSKSYTCINELLKNNSDLIIWAILNINFFTVEDFILTHPKLFKNNDYLKAVTINKIKSVYLNRLVVEYEKEDYDDDGYYQEDERENYDVARDAFEGDYDAYNIWND
ncbi:hypothetical protein [Myroides sp. DF42-4-2]|uniref:hypothetical protein n=1 Tax=unclassified Myroides TaxID=2642485 RepID=UPI002577DE7D|nr:hypothetical protein [Myroides sp. DF42-4-2]MDM1408064.1 hypothetical protein [Myroides sp. DF42-4-2]